VTLVRVDSWIDCLLNKPAQENKKLTSVTDKKDFYERAGIVNQADFYGNLFASGELLHPDYFQALERFHIRWSRTMWVYDNVAPASTVLDLGSGAGLLALLKRKGVKLFGIDLSAECAKVTRRNGYDFACAGDLRALPFVDECFDYVVSLDVLGHIEFAQKDAVLAEMRRVLKPNGLTMHGIETMNTERRKDYDQMSDEELKRFVQIDGHVGMESEPDTKARFSAFFSHVRAEPRFSICQSVEELVKQADEYLVPLCDPDFLEYLRNLSHNERRAFNMAMGYLFQQISDLGISLPRSEYLFLKAANGVFGSFYNEHRDRSALLALAPADEIASLNQTTVASFDGGWYPAENFPPVGRWLGKRGQIRFSTIAFSKLRCDITSHMPELATNPLEVKLFLNGETLHELSIGKAGWQTLELCLPAQKLQTPCASECILEVHASRTWQPCSTNQDSSDDRELSIAIANLELVK
jgi:ubiquinone/menaquinone biosynthesis C-methylase UbiE